jgi:hypothetical protein
LAEVHFPRAKTVVLVQDNLNIHSKAPRRRRRDGWSSASNGIARPRLFGGDTPFWHGSWLDLAESELGILPAQCLDRRIPDKRPSSTKSPPGRASETHNTKSDWHFTTKDARTKL